MFHVTIIIKILKKAIVYAFFNFGMEIASNMVAVTCNGELNA